MTLRHQPLGIALGLVALLLATGVSADASIPTADIDGSRDPAMLKRYEGSFIVSYDARDFDELVLPLAPLVADPDPKRRDEMNNRVFAPTEALTLEGRATRIVYLIPEGRSPLEVVRNYGDEVAAAGGRVLFECKQDGCGGDPGRASSGGGGRMSLAMLLRPQSRIGDALQGNGYCAQMSRIQDQRYLVAELPEQNAHLSVLAYVLQTPASCKAFAGRTVAVVDLVEGKPREQKMVTVAAPEMARAIASTGRIALYGILFDFDQATVKPESAPTLTEIAALLAADPKLRLLVVGHTDNQGSLDYNRGLSQRRAEAVVSALGRDHGADTTRLLPVGVGFAAPVATNATEEGRAQNRRVELVAY